MTAVRATFDIRDLEVGVRRAVRDDMPFIVAASLTKTAKRAQDDVKAQMPLIFDRPTRWTLNSTAVRPATKRQPEAAVFFREFAGKSRAGGKYLQPQAFGGPRSAKGVEQAVRRRGLLGAGEFLVPARGYRLNQYGNLPGSLITRILSQLQVTSDAHQWETARSRKRNNRRRVARYFWADGRGGLPKGIAERSGKRVRMVMVAVGAPNYRKRFPLDDLVAASAAKHGLRIFRDVAAGVFEKQRRP